MVRFSVGQAHFKNGRVWHGYRKHWCVRLYRPAACELTQRARVCVCCRLWRLSQRYMNMELLREAPLDAKQQYIFPCYPHGILILSRVAMCKLSVPACAGPPLLLMLLCSCV